ncbi:MFS transporter [Subtercola vilae]|uniref:MFS transporter n=1 Tax=Subtercola vilae TaxID=2056433 RepID=A0A4T2BXB6_9MICO|nr:MFS transporter [Subtercola vilae]TIH36603.1 MFS transporter [Subtercola vilae]
MFDTLPAARRRFALVALALGAFGIGIAEFVTSGLLPNIARDLDGATYAVDPASAIASAGLLVSAYALGVVVGAPAIAAATAHWPQKRVLLLMLAVFVVANFAVALLPSFHLVLAARFLSGLPHGAFLGTAGLLAASLMGPGKRGRGVAFIAAGLTLATIVGVPLGSIVGGLLGWRAIFVIIAGIFALALVAVLAAIPSRAGNPEAGIRSELRAFLLPQVWLTVGMGAIGFGGMFAVFTYIAPIASNVTGIGDGMLPWVLVVFGLGMTGGSVAASRVSDLSVAAALLVFLGGMALSLAGFVLFAATLAGLLVFTFLLGIFAGGSSVAIQTRLMDVAAPSRAVGAALTHSALNLGNALGAYLGGLVIAAGFGYLSPAVIGAALSLIGVGIVVVALLLGRRAAVSASTAHAQPGQMTAQTVFDSR